MGSKYNGSDKELISLDSYIILSRATESINLKINRMLKEAGFTENQFKVIDALYHLGPLTQKTLGEKLLTSGGNITMVIDNLEIRGLVKRIRGTDDRRLFSINLTKKGVRETENILPKVVKMIIAEMKVLSNKEHKQLQLICKRIGLKQKHLIYNP